MHSAHDTWQDNHPWDEVQFGIWFLWQSHGICLSLILAPSNPPASVSWVLGLQTYIIIPFLWVFFWFLRQVSKPRLDRPSLATILPRQSPKPGLMLVFDACLICYHSFTPWWFNMFIRSRMKWNNILPSVAFFILGFNQQSIPLHLDTFTFLLLRIQL